jgi:hypothetical protein
MIAWVVGAALMAWLSWLVWDRHRQEGMRRARLTEFFSERHIKIVGVKEPSRITYGYPGYTLAFASAEESAAFKSSKHFPEFLGIVQEIHGHHGPRRRPFDAREAVHITP